jgi:hypothetical protein
VGHHDRHGGGGRRGREPVLLHLQPTAFARPTPMSMSRSWRNSATPSASAAALHPSEVVASYLDGSLPGISRSGRSRRFARSLRASARRRVARPAPAAPRRRDHRGPSPVNRPQAKSAAALGQKRACGPGRHRCRPPVRSPAAPAGT